ncbi:MAG: M23 family metallopeptidase [Bacteroidota bacterium]
MKCFKQYFIFLYQTYLRIYLTVKPFSWSAFLIIISLGLSSFIPADHDLSPTSSTAVPHLKPVEKGLILSAYGVRMHPIFKKLRMHHGVDFEARLNTPVFATADGVVTHAGYKENGYGFYVEIKHRNGFITRYAHLHRFGIRVKKKQKVSAGDLVGLSGNTGRSIGPHLHYEILKKGIRVDPFEYLPLGVKVQERSTSQD